MGALTEVMEILPASVADSGVWVSNPVPALELSGLRPASTGEEWMSRTPQQQQSYWVARSGIPNSGMHHTLVQSYPDWDETFGFGAWQVGAMAETGETQGVGFQVNLLFGQFDPAKISEKLQGLGYELCDHPGGAYLALPEGKRIKRAWLEPFTVNSKMRNVFALERAVLTAPTSGQMEELLSVRAGRTPALGDHPAFGDLASFVGDPLFASVLNRRVVPGAAFLSSRAGIQFEQPEHWGSTGNWEALMAAYSRLTPESQEITVALWYADIREAREAVQEFSRRFGIEPSEPFEFFDHWYLQDVCADSWETEAFGAPNGAIVAISCQLQVGPSSESLGSLMHSALVEGSLGFLLE